MAEIVTIPDKIKTSDIPDSELNTIGKFSKKVIHHNAGPPTAADDTGLGYAAGSIWVDSTNGDTYTCTASTAEDATWINMEGDDINPPFVMQGATYGWIAGGISEGGPSSTALDEITRFTFASNAGGTDVGDMAGVRAGIARGSIRSSTQGFIAGGFSTPSWAFFENVDAFTFASPSTVTDAGDLGATVYDLASASDGTTGFAFGGVGSGMVDTCTKMVMAAPHTVSDNGEITAARDLVNGFSDLTYAYCVAGSEPSYTDTIERFPFAATSGTFADAGEITRTVRGGAGCNGPTKGFYGGGSVGPNHIDTFTFASPSTSADVGELGHNGNGYLAGGSSSTDYAFFTGGYSSTSVTTNAISKMAWTSTSGGSTDFGELTNHFPLGGTPGGVSKSGNGYES